MSAPTVIPVCDYWNRGKTEVLSTQDGRMRIQGQTNISSANAADNHEFVIGGGQVYECYEFEPNFDCGAVALENLVTFRFW